MLTRGQIALKDAVKLFIITLNIFFALKHDFLPSFGRNSFAVGVDSLPNVSLRRDGGVKRHTRRLLLAVPRVRAMTHGAKHTRLSRRTLNIGISRVRTPFRLGSHPHGRLITRIHRGLKAVANTGVRVNRPVDRQVSTVLSNAGTGVTVGLFNSSLGGVFSLNGQVGSTVKSVPNVTSLGIRRRVRHPRLGVRPGQRVLTGFKVALPRFSRCIGITLTKGIVSRICRRKGDFSLVMGIGSSTQSRVRGVHGLVMSAGSNHGIPLGCITRIISTVKPGAVGHRGIGHGVIVSTGITSHSLQDIMGSVRGHVSASVRLPRNCRVRCNKRFRDRRTTDQALTLASFVDVIIVFLLLCGRFHDIGRSNIVLLGLPLTLVNNIFTLIVAANRIDVPTVVKFVSLFNVTAEGNVLLVDRCGRLRGRRKLGMCSDIVRNSLSHLGPVLVATLSSTLTLVPLTLNNSLPKGRVRDPVTGIVLNKLLASAFLGNFVIPVICLVVRHQPASTTPRRRSLTAPYWSSTEHGEEGGWGGGCRASCRCGFFYYRYALRPSKKYTNARRREANVGGCEGRRRKITNRHPASCLTRAKVRGKRRPTQSCLILHSPLKDGKRGQGGQQAHHFTRFQLPRPMYRTRWARPIRNENLQRPNKHVPSKRAITNREDLSKRCRTPPTRAGSQEGTPRHKDAH